MSLEDLKQDLEKEANRISNARYLEAKNALENHVIPLFESLLYSLEARFQESEEALAELLEETASILQPDAAAKIKAALQAGLELAQYTLTFESPAAKPYADAFMLAYGEAFKTVDDAELEEVEVEADDEDDADDDEDSDEDSDDSEAATAESAVG